MTSDPMHARTGEVLREASLAVSLWQMHTTDALQEASVTLTQWRTLDALAGAGEPQPLSAIARHLGQAAQSLTEVADRMERRGLVQRQRNPADRRLVLLALTDTGRETYAGMAAAIDRLERQMPPDVAAAFTRITTWLTEVSR